jgi:hypothetical protein
VELKVLQGGRSRKRRRGLLARLRTFWRTAVVRRVLLAITGWILIDGGRAENRPGRAV